MVELICCFVMYASTASLYASALSGSTSGTARIITLSALNSGSSVDAVRVRVRVRVKVRVRLGIGLGLGQGLGLGLACADELLHDKR
jgi:hypothetical protein